jgi:hypothetical protein
MNPARDQILITTGYNVSETNMDYKATVPTEATLHIVLQCHALHNKTFISNETGKLFIPNSAC